MKICPCKNCLVQPICKECCLEHQQWLDSLSLNEKLKYFREIKDNMKTVSPKVRREYNKLKYGYEFA
jgi:hypothetical protein